MGKELDYLELLCNVVVCVSDVVLNNYRFLGSQSPPVQQFPITTHTAQTRMNTECGVESAREANRENCEQRDRQRANTGAVAQVTRARQWPETAPTLGLRAKKIPTDKS